MRFTKSLARVWGKVALLIFTSLIGIDPAYSQDYESHPGNRFAVSNQFQSHLMISEILYQASGSGSGEWIEIFNPTSNRIDLSEYQILNQGKGGKRIELMIPEGVFIAPNSFLVISKPTAKSAFNSYYGFDADLYLNWNDRELANSGEKINLVDSSGSVIDYVAWKNGEPGGWGNGPSTGADETLCRISDPIVDTDTASDWQVCGNGGNPQTQPDEIFVWTGTNSSSWSSGNNWIGGESPGFSPSLHIEIPATQNDPVLDVPLVISGITVRLPDGSILTVENSASLTIEKNGEAITENGSFISVKPTASYFNYGTSSPDIRIEKTINGAKGWRMITSPFESNFNQLSESGLVTQGFNGTNYPDKQHNVLWWDESSIGTTLQGWRSPLSTDETLELGRGYFHYVFDGAGVSGSDRFYSDSLPLLFTMTGIEPTIGDSGFTFPNVSYTPHAAQSREDEQNTTFNDIIVADVGWNLIGNPTASTIDWDASGWIKENISETIYIWDPNANEGTGDYQVWNGSVGSLQDGRIAPLQAFWIKATGPDPVLSVTNDAKELSADFKGKSGQTQSDANQVTPSVKLTLSSSGYEKNIWLSFSENGRMGYDSWDAFELLPMSENWMTFNTSGSETKSPGLVINHLPSELPDDRTLLNLVMGLYENYRPSSTEFKLRWERTGSWPRQSNIFLQDHSAGVMYPIGAKADSIRFFHRSPELQDDIAAKRSNSDSIRPFPLPQGGSVVNDARPCSGGDCDVSGKEKSGNSSRFSILISNSEDTDYLPPSPILQQNYPNPFNPETTISFLLPKESDVRLQIFDLLGREITTLADGVYEAGAHQVKWSAGSVSSGIYLYRMTIDGRPAITRKMTVMK